MGATGGTETQTLTEAQMPAHRHLVANSTFNGSTLTGSNSINFTKSDGGDGNYNLVGTSSEPTLGRTSATGGGGAHNNVQPTIILNYIIKT
jgi:microcystin-dependent protein